MKNQEIWKDIKNFEGYYQVSSYGNVKSVDRAVRNGPKRIGYRNLKGKMLATVKDSYGYFSLQIKNKTYRVHSLVAEAFIGERPKGYVVDHIDDNPENNTIDNLQYIPHYENIIKGNRLKKTKSEYPNVMFRKDRNTFVASLIINKEKIHVGSFSNAEDAYLAVINYRNENTH